MCSMHWEKSPPAGLASTRPYQGVRVRDPVKELLRRKRGLEAHTANTAPSAVDAVRSQSSYVQGNLAFEGSSVTTNVSSIPGNDGSLSCMGWRAQASAANATAGLQHSIAHWSSSGYGLHDQPSSQSQAYTGCPTLTADMYMQTICPSYTVVAPPTMLTYTHAPLLGNFGTIPVASTPASLPQMDLPESGLTYVPWGQPLTTISTIPTSGVHLTPCSPGLPGSPLVHMPLSMPLTAMVAQLETQREPLSQALDFQQPSSNLLNPRPQPQPLDPDPVDEAHDLEPEPPNPLEKLLEESNEERQADEKDTYNASLFLPNV